jgi:hypothetical protein
MSFRVETERLSLPQQIKAGSLLMLGIDVRSGPARTGLIVATAGLTAGLVRPGGVAVVLTALAIGGPAGVLSGLLATVTMNPDGRIVPRGTIGSVGLVLAAAASAAAVAAWPHLPAWPPGMRLGDEVMPTLATAIIAAVVAGVGQAIVLHRRATVLRDAIARIEFCPCPPDATCAGAGTTRGISLHTL